RVEGELRPPASPQEPVRLADERATEGGQRDAKLTPIALASLPDQEPQRCEHATHGRAAHAEGLAEPALRETGVRPASATQRPPAPVGTSEQNEEQVVSRGSESHRAEHRPRDPKRAMVRPLQAEEDRVHRRPKEHLACRDASGAPPLGVAPLRVTAFLPTCPKTRAS